MNARRAAIELGHVLGTFAVALAGMAAASSQPVTRDLLVSLAPAAAVATFRALEARAAKSGT